MGTMCIKMLKSRQLMKINRVWLSLQHTHMHSQFNGPVWKWLLWLWLNVGFQQLNNFTIEIHSNGIGKYGYFFSRPKCVRCSDIRSRNDQSNEIFDAVVVVVVIFFYFERINMKNCLILFKRGILGHKSLESLNSNSNICCHNRLTKFVNFPHFSMTCTRTVQQLTVHLMDSNHEPKKNINSNTKISIQIQLNHMTCIIYFGTTPLYVSIVRSKCEEKKH